MPFPPIPAFEDLPPLEAGDLAIKGDIEVDAFDNVARFSGLSTGVFSNMPFSTFFGNLYTVDGPGRAFPATQVAGAGLTYTNAIENGPFPEIVFEGSQSFIVTGTTHTIDLPPNILAGHRIIFGTYHNQAAQSVTTPTGFTLLGKVETTDGEVNVYERIYDGTSNDPQVELDIVSSVTSSLLVYLWHIKFAHSSNASEVVTQLEDSAAATSNNLGLLSPTWASGTVSALYLAFIGIEADVTAPNITAFPATFVGTGQQQITSATASLDGAIGWAHLGFRGTGLNPTTFTYGPARSGAFLIAVPPAVSGRLNVGSSTSIVVNEDDVQRAALTGAIAAAQNSNATLFSGIRVGGAATTDRTNINFIAGAGVTITPTDDAGADEIEITIAATPGGGAGWDDTLSVDNHTGLFNPFIDNGQHINFGTAAAGAADGDIRGNSAFKIHVDETFDIEAHDNIHIYTPDAITIESTGGSTVEMLSSSVVRLHSTSSSVEMIADAGDALITVSDDVIVLAGDSIDETAGGDIFFESTAADFTVTTPAGSVHLVALSDIDLTAAVVNLGSFMRMPEQAASTPTVGAGNGLWWTRNLVPSRPYFTDDTDVDFQIALLPIALSDVETIAAESFLGNFTAGAAVPTARAGSLIAGGGLTYTAGGTIAVGAGTYVTVNANDVTVNRVALSADLDSASVIDNAGVLERAALTGAITAAQNSNATLFGGILDNGVAENNRTNLNFIAGTNTTATVTDDAGNDELEIRFNVDDFPLTGLADQAAETFLGNFTAGAAAPTARAGASVAGGGLTYTAGGTLAVGAGTYVTVNANDVAVDRVTLAGDMDSTSVVNNAGVLERAALTGAIIATQNSNATLFGGILDNGVAENNRTNLNFIAGTNTTAPVTDDAGNDELEIRFNVDDFPLTGLADQAAETFLGNFTAGSAAPTAVAGSTVAGAGLTYATGGILAVGAGTYITVNANDVAVNRTALSADLDSTSVVNNAGVLERAALTGAITATQNSNATLFSGIRVGGAATTDRTNINFIAGAGISITPTDDAANDEIEVTIATSAAPGHTIRDDGVDETQRAALNFVSTTSVIAVATDDAVNNETEITLERAALTGDVTAAQNSNATTIANDAVTYAKLQNGAGFSVVGKATTGAGDNADIVAAADTVLRRSGTGDVAFGSLVTNNYANDSVTFAKMENGAGFSVVGKATTGAGDNANIVAAADQVLRRSGSGDLGFGTLVTNNIGDDQVTNAKLANMAANTIKANATAGSADPADLAVGTNAVVGRVAGNIVAAQLVTGQIADDQVTNGKLDVMGGNTVKLNPSSSSANPVDLAFVERAVLGRSSGNLANLGQTDIAKILGLPDNNAGGHVLLWEDMNCNQSIPGGNLTVAAGPVHAFFTSTGNGLPWFVQAFGGTGATSRANNTVGRNGIFNLDTGAAASNQLVLYMARDLTGSVAVTEGVINFSDVVVADFYVLIDTITNVSVVVGLAQDISATSLGTDGVVFTFAPTDNASWMCRSRAASTNATPVDSAVDAAADVWYKLTIWRVSSSLVNYYIDNVFVGSISTNIPTGAVCPGVSVTTTTAALRRVQVSRVRIWADDACQIGA
jgi:hypothetical protein